MGGLNGGVELDVVTLAAPEIAHVCEEVVDLVGFGIHRAKLVGRNVNVGVLDSVWIQIDTTTMMLSWPSRLAAAKDGGVIGAVETQIIKGEGPGSVSDRLIWVIQL